MSVTGKKFVSLLLTTAMIAGLFALAPVTGAAAGAISLDPSVEYQTMEGWGTSICWWGNTVGTWIGATNEKSIAYGLSLNPPVENMEVRDAIIHMFFSPDAMNLNMARFCVGGGDRAYVYNPADGGYTQNSTNYAQWNEYVPGETYDYAKTTIRRLETMVPGWSIDMYGDYNSNNGGAVVDEFWTKPIRDMNDYGQLYVLREAARLRQEYCDRLGIPNDFVVEVFSNSPPWYMTESGLVTGALGKSAAAVRAEHPDWARTTASPGTTGNADNLVKEKDIADFAAYMATACMYMDNMLAPYGAKVDMVNPMNEPGCRYWGGDHGGNMWKQEGCNVNFGPAQDKVLRATRAALDAVGMDDVFLTMGETDYGTTTAGYYLYAEDVKDIVPLVGAHAYQTDNNNVKGSNDINRIYLRDLMKSHDKTLWQVELGQSNGSFLTGQMNGARLLSRSINRDLKEAQVSAWMDWCPAEPMYNNLTLSAQNTVSGLGGWGLLQVNSNSTAYGVEGEKYVTMFGKKAGPYPRESQGSLFLGGSNTGASQPKYEILEALGYGDYAYVEGKSLYAHMQYSRFIKMGYTQIDIGHDQMVAFISPDQKELVVVAYTWNSNATFSPTAMALVNSLNTTVNLDAFPGAGTAEVYRTTAGSSAANLGDSCVRIADQDVSNGTLNVNLSSDQIYTYVIRNDEGESLFDRDVTFNKVNSEVVCTDAARYSSINKFSYEGLNSDWTKQMWHQPFPIDSLGNSVFTPSGDFALHYMSWESRYAPTNYTTWTASMLANNPSRNAYGYSVRRAVTDGASVSFTFDGDGAAIWGLQKDGARAATFSVELDGALVAANLSNAGVNGTNACLYDTGSIFGDGPHTITVTKIGANGELDIGNALIRYEWAAEVSVTGPATVVNGPGATAEYMISGWNLPMVSGVELEFEIDGGYLGAKDALPVGFDIFGSGNYGSAIYWRNDGDAWIGKITLINPDGVSGDRDLLKLVFDAKAGALGATDVKLLYVLLSYAGETVPASIKDGVVTTVLEKYYVPWDLNKDEVVDLHDITFALQYFMAKEGDPDWDEAKIADINGDKVVNLEDLLLILANYTVPYYG